MLWGKVTVILPRPTLNTLLAYQHVPICLSLMTDRCWCYRADTPGTCVLYYSKINHRHNLCVFMFTLPRGITMRVTLFLYAEVAKFQLRQLCCMLSSTQGILCSSLLHGEKDVTFDFESLLKIQQCDMIHIDWNSIMCVCEYP